MPAPQEPPLTFRPGKVVDHFLKRFAQKHTLSMNSAAKRLMVLALFGRSATDYEKFGSGRTCPEMLAKLIEAKDAEATKG